MNRITALRTVARWWALLLVLVIALQALAPVGNALVVRSGSAFSADTIEVAVAPPRRTAETVVVALPAPPPPPLVPALAMPLLAVLFAAPLPKPRATAPPQRAPTLSRPSSPRAPPLA